MGRPKGSKNKTDGKRAKENKVVLPTVASDSGVFNMDDREKLYEQYDESRPSEDFTDLDVTETSDVTEDAVVAAVEEATTEATPEETVETETVTETTETEEEEVAEPIKVDETISLEKGDEKDDLLKTVPHGAFHEEREKRKAAQKEAEEKDRQLQQLIDDNKKLMESRAEETYEDPDNRELSEIKKELAEIKARDQQRDKQSQSQAVEQQLEKADKFMTERGKPGLSKWGKPFITQELQKLYAEDPAAAVAHDNPEGWAKIWDRKYDELASEFSGHKKGELFEAKKNLKKDAAMITSPGKSVDGAKPEQKKKSPYEEYMELRDKYRV